MGQRVISGTVSTQALLMTFFDDMSPVLELVSEKRMDDCSKEQQRGDEVQRLLVDPLQEDVP
jgi:hypothetical protein